MRQVFEKLEFGKHFQEADGSTFEEMCQMVEKHIMS
jgi:hypothetical protein